MAAAGLNSAGEALLAALDAGDVGGAAAALAGGATLTQALTGSFDMFQLGRDQLLPRQPGRWLFRHVVGR